MKRPIRKKIRQESRKSSVRRPRKVHPKRPTTARQYFSKSKKFQQIWDSVAHVISKMRANRISLPRASKEFGIDPSLVIKLGRSALRKQKNGRYVAKKSDRLLRILSVLSSDGRQEVALRDSKQASLLGKYWDAVQKYLQTGDDSALGKFRKKKITDARGKRHLLLTDLKELDRLGSAGILSFESLYAGVR